MKSEFNPELPHQENVKVAIEKILGQKITLGRRKKTEADQRKALFSTIISKIVEAEERSGMLDEALGVNLNNYNKIFFEIIDSFLNFSFSKEQIKLIDFFLYDRYNADGTMIELRDKSDFPIKLDNTDDLWNLLKGLENATKQ
jgi:hypothetical protein